MTNLADVFADDVTGHSIDLMRFDASVRREILGILIDLQESLVNEISSISPSDPARLTTKFRRKEVLLNNVLSMIRTSYRGMNSLMSANLVEMAGMELERTSAFFNSSIGVNLMTVDSSPQLVRELARGTLIEGAIAREWWSRQAGSLRQNFEDQMTQGILAGENNSQLIQRVRGTHTGRFTSIISNGVRRRVGVFSGGIMDTTTRKAEALVRTAVQSVANEARMETYNQNSNLIKGVQAVVTLDSKTSDICMARSGKVWKLDGTPVPPNTDKFPGPPPWHFNCRTTLIAITKSFAELTGTSANLSERNRRALHDLPKGTQSSMDGAVAADLNYESWLRTKPVAFQKEKLGLGRWEMWNKGQLSSLSQLIDQTGRPRTLLQLQEKFIN